MLKGLGYDNQVVMNKGKGDAMNFVHPKRKHEENMSTQMSQHQDDYSGSKTQQWKCHHYGRFGHIKPYCYKLYGYPKPASQPRRKQTIVKAKKKWIPRNDTSRLIYHTSLRASARENWYFDSGCSRHMTGVKKFLVDIKSYSTRYVTFGDGSKGEIKGVGKLDYPGLPSLDDVLFVKGITANLISISQLCDQGHKVNFTKSECLVTNEKNEVIMKGAR
jgi:hypothetical protein